MDHTLFLQACEQIIGIQRERNGIGTLGEKTVHAVLKHYLEPDENYHEIKIEGFFADIANENGIIEIQTRNFNTLRKKLRTFLPQHKVTIVYPVPYTKWLCWIDEETGELSKKRKSPQTGCPHLIFRELYRIKEFLTDPNLHLHIILMNMEEYRLLNGWSKDKKRGSSRYDRIPINIVEEFHIDSKEDYRLFLPEQLSDDFTAKDYRKAVKIPLSQAQAGVHLLNYMETIKRNGSRGRAYLYERNL